MIRLVLVDDHRIVHQALAEMIDLVDDFELVGQGSNGEEAIKLCLQHKPDIVLMDVVMPIMDGIEATKQILRNNASIKILGLSSFEDTDSVQAMLANGAIGYVLKTTSVDDLERIIRTVNDGKSVIDTSLMPKLMSSRQATPEDQYHLSPREQEILSLIAEGMGYQEIANSLTISLSTVKFHVSNILKKFDVESRSAAIAIAAKNGII